MAKQWEIEEMTGKIYIYQIKELILLDCAHRRDGKNKKSAFPTNVKKKLKKYYY